MLACYDEADINPALGSGKSWENLIIRRIHYNRDDVFDKTVMHQTVRDDDGVPNASGNWVYNHYVPHSRITYALIDEIYDKKMTRREALVWLRNVTTRLKLEPDHNLGRYSQPLTRRFDFDVFVEWAFETCAEFPENIFYGPGSGNHGGTTLAIPEHSAQLDRVQKAAIKLKRAIGKKLSLAKIKKSERYEKAIPGDERPYVEGDLWFNVLGNADLPENDDEDSDFK